MEAAFRTVDRGLFLPPALKRRAYSDNPLRCAVNRRMLVHHSAPHLYSMVLSSLELEARSAQSFLCIGSGAI